MTGHVICATTFEESNDWNFTERRATNNLVTASGEYYVNCNPERTWLTEHFKHGINLISREHNVEALHEVAAMQCRSSEYPASFNKQDTRAD